MSEQNIGAIRRGSRAKAELQLVETLLTEMKQAAVERIMTSNEADKINIERLIVTYQVADKILNGLQNFVVSGKGYEALASLENETQ